MSFQTQAGAGNPPAQPLSISISTGLAATWSAQASTASGGGWLSVLPRSGGTPAVASVSVNATGLAAGTYQGTVTVQAPQASPPTTQTVAVTLTVQSANPAQLAVDPSSLAFGATAGAGNPATQTLRVSNAGGGTLNWTASTSTASGSQWLVLGPSSGSATAAVPSVVQVTANVGNLAVGTYSGSVTVTSSTTGETKTVPVTLLISPVSATLLVSQTGLSFTGVQGGGGVASQNFGILNIGQGVMNWTVGASTVAGGNWLSVSPTNGSSTGNSLQIPLVDVAVNVAGLAAGQYSGQVCVDAPGANDAPQCLTVDLTVLPAGSNPGVLVRPTGLIFAALAGGSSPAAQNVSLSTTSATSVQARVIPSTFDGASWLNVVLLNAAPIVGLLPISAASPTTIVAQTTTGSLPPGVYRGGITFLFTDGSPLQGVNILFSVVSPAATPAIEGQAADLAAACAPSKLLLAERKLGSNFLSLVSSPTSIEVQLKDDCGNPVPSAANQPLPEVRASFSSGEPSISLVHAGNGIYQGTWQPANATAMTVTVRASLPPLAPVEVQVQGTLKENLTAAALSPAGIVSAATFASGAPLSPGAIIAVFGRKLAPGITGATTLPLNTTLGGATLSVAGVNLPLFFSSPGQINAQLPFNLNPNSRAQAVLRTRLGDTAAEFITVPQTLILAAVSPGIFTTDSSGTGQGEILVVGTASAAAPRGSLAGRDARPVKRGEEFIAIFATGLGDVSNRPPPGAAALTNPLSETLLKPTVTIGGAAAEVSFSGLAPFFAGLYQVNAKVPPEAPTGDAVPLVLTIGGVRSNRVTIAVE